MATLEVQERVQEQERTNHPLSADVAFEILADRHRRTALSHLLERDTSVTIADLVEAVVATDGTADSRERVRASFVHNHLPKLADAGVIEYTPTADVVEPRPAIDAFEPLLAIEARSISA